MTPKREVVLVISCLGDPLHIDDGSKWDAGKRREAYVPASELDRVRRETLEEAAKECDAESAAWQDAEHSATVAAVCASRIRALGKGE